MLYMFIGITFQLIDTLSTPILQKLVVQTTFYIINIYIINNIYVHSLACFSHVYIIWYNMIKYNITNSMNDIIMFIVLYYK